MTLILVFALVGCTFAPPIEDDTSTTLTSGVSLSGDVLLADGSTPDGPTVILLYDAADPPPLGSPVDITTVPAGAWSTAGGVWSAPWSITGVSTGTWLLSALLDVDANFNPFFDFAAGATCTDHTGAYLASSASTSPAPITVEAPDTISDITLLLGSALTTQRPAFTLAEPVTITQPTSLEAYAAAPQMFQLASTGVDHEILTLDDPTDSGSACPAVFTVTLTDDNGDGQVDMHEDEVYAQFGLRDVWPKVYLFLYQPADGSQLEEGESWLTEAAVYADAYLLAGYEAGDSFQSSTLPLVFVPGALHTLADGSQETVYAPDLPTGAWGIAVVTATNQTWFTPNQLADPDTAALFGAEADAGQAAVITLQ